MRNSNYSEGFYDSEGNYYPTEREMALAHGIKPTTYCQRKMRGYTLEDRLKPARGYNNESGGFEYDGKVYSSLKNCCECLNISPSSVYNKILNTGCSPIEAIEFAIKRRDKKLPVAPNGKQYKTYADMARDYGIEPILFYARKNRGLTLEECLEPFDGYAVEGPNGVIYDSEAQMARDYGVDPDVYYARKFRGLSMRACLKS